MLTLSRLRRRSRQAVIAELAPGHPAVVRTDPQSMTMTAAVLPAEARVTAPDVMEATEMPTVLAALAGTTTTTVGEATVRLRAAPLSMTTRLPEAATTSRTAVTTLPSHTQTAGLRTIALLLAISRRRHAMATLPGASLHMREMGMSVGVTGN